MGVLRGNYLGLFGYVDSGAEIKNLTLLDCDIAGRSDADYIGALAGVNFGTIERCCATGCVSGRDKIGGLVGFSSNGSMISDCYAQVSVTGDDELGGLVGRSYNSTIRYCYSTGTVSGDTDVGGFMGKNESSSITACFWDVQTSLLFSSAGGTGKTTSEMQDESTFTGEGWDFVGETSNGTHYIWTIESGNVDYPRFSFGGIGTETDPFVIRSREVFDMICADDLYWAGGVHIRLETDIDLDGTVFTAAVIAPDTSTSYGFQGTAFEGTFDGGGHAVRNLNINVETTGGLFIGLFGGTGVDAVIRNLGVVDCDLYGGNPGGLVGKNLGLIDNCYATGVVTGADYSGTTGGLVSMSQIGRIQYCHTNVAVSVDGGDLGIGGLVGNNSGGSDIANCYALGSVSGAGASEDVGGLVGTNYGSSDIANSYATGAVGGGATVGGLCGSNASYSHIDTCYAAGALSGSATVGGLVGFNDESSSATVSSDCFWDIDTSGQSSSDGGTGKTTEQMKTVSTFLDAGWDMVTVWNMEEDQTYPLLRKYSACDTNYDGRVDLIDFAMFAQHWLQ